MTAMARPPAALPAPTRLGRWRLLAPLGEGATAVVWKAADDRDQTVAIKLLRPEAWAREDLRRRFVAEARALSALRHPNVLRVHEVVEEPDRAWCVMDLVEEGSLQQAIDRDGPLPEPEALRVVFEALCALGAAHARGFVHRDVKPSNLLVRASGEVFLGDFGSARLDANGPGTKTGDVLGTLGYMPPEQRIDARRAGPATDVYAAGATLFGLVTGRGPLGLFEGQLDEDRLSRLGDQVRAVLERATRYRPEHRYPTARDMAVDVVRAYDKLVGSANEAAWMARFDRGVAGAPEAPAGWWARVSGWFKRAPALPEPPPAPRTRTPVPPASCAGVWEGRMGGLLPLRLELDDHDGRVTGWAIATGMKGERIASVEGTIDAEGNLVVVEREARDASGTYSGSMEGDTLEGTFEGSDQPDRPLPFSVHRRR